ncbi:diheme cytochrome c [Rhodoferax sp.]|uniref:diheme cytochrome c n=1 Tax=Rhodoferax sp. TaxID=50421 RepID=UPI002848A312|nr:diheme cytochrome c [Rhodoferax sp.]MDR3367608.1 diheme cytochrome c [Rhodoferax sp.]
MRTLQFIRTSLLVVLAVVAVAAQAKNNTDNRSKQAMPATVEATWHTECSGCHDAYAPGLLPAASWQKVMSGLDKHFGTDASLPPPETEKIAAFLEKHASNRWGSSAAPMRITESQWWRSRHDEVRRAVWERPSVKSRSNCSACHQGANQGDFDEDRVRIPK